MDILINGYVDDNKNIVSYLVLNEKCGLGHAKYFLDSYPHPPL